MKRMCHVLAFPFLVSLGSLAQAQPVPPLTGYPPEAIIVQGDIIVSNPLIDSAWCGTSWPIGFVPYVFHSNVTTTNRALMREAMNEIACIANVRFVETSSSPIISHLVIRDSTLNSSSVGMQPISQAVNIVSWTSKFVMVHELLHALGNHHEQSRPDRGGFVQINFQNVSGTACGGNCAHNFDIVGCATSYGPYDFDSVMHYGQFSFSSNGLPTIQCLPAFASFQTTMGQRGHLSIQDATSTAIRYGAPPVPTVTSISITTLPAGSGNPRIRVFGTNFFKGSSSSTGVLGTRVHFNNTEVPTEYVSPTEVIGVVPDELMALEGTFPVAVFNQYPGGGWSNSHGLTLTPGYKKVMLTEVAFGDLEGVEICNFDDQPHSILGWRVRWQNGNSAPLDSFTPGNVTIQPGQIIVFLDPFFASVAELPNSIIRFPLPQLTTTSSHFSVALLDASETVIDEVRITNTSVTQAGNDLGGRFRGYARRGTYAGVTGAVGVERIWGLDSNTGTDWTDQPNRSLGLENRSSGPRGSAAPFGFFVEPPRLLINEIDDNPDYVEIVNVGTYTIPMGGFYFLASGDTGSPPVRIRPFSFSLDLLPGGYVVVGEGPRPVECQLTVPYIDIVPAGFNFPMSSSEFTLGLYGPEGALIDLVRTTGTSLQVVHNYPRLPSAWNDFTGSAGRNGNNGEGVIARDPALADSDRGSDWRPAFRRSMGAVNFSNQFAGPPGLGDQLDVRIEDTSPGRGIALVVNAGASMAGKRFRLLSSYQHSFGAGPLMGLGFDAFTNWIQFQSFEPWSATLDSLGSYRFDLPPGTLPPIAADHIAFVFDPLTGAALLRTKILEEDH